MEEMVNETNTKNTDNLNKIINYKKQKIMTVFFQTQNYIMRSCFNCEFNSVKTLSDIHNLKNKLYEYKNVIGYNADYTYYNDFYRLMMNMLVQKKEQLEKSGQIVPNSANSTALIIIDTRKGKLQFIKTFYQKLRELFKPEINRNYINE